MVLWVPYLILGMAAYATPLIAQAAYGIMFFGGLILGLVPIVIWRYLAAEFDIDFNGLLAVFMFLPIFFVVSVFGRLFVELCLTNYRILENLSMRSVEEK